MEETGTQVSANIFNLIIISSVTLFSCTTNMFASVGDYHPGGGGIKESLIKNESDGAFVAVQVFESTSDVIEYTLPFYDEYLQFVCSYNYTEHSKANDMLDSYLEFHWHYYVSVLLTLVLFMVTWSVSRVIQTRISRRIREELRGYHFPGYWIVTSALLEKRQYPNVSSTSLNLILFCLTLFCFLTVRCFMMNMVRTDLVTIQQPQVVRTYQDVFDRDDLKLLFIDGSQENVFFKDAKEGTREAKIWKKRHIFGEISAAEIAKVWEPIFWQKIAFLGRSTYGQAAAMYGLRAQRDQNRYFIRAFTSIDETGKSFTNSFMTQKYAPKVFREFMHQRARRLAQSGIYTWVNKVRVPILFGGGNEIILDQLVSSKLFLPEPPEPKITLKHTITLWMFFFVLVSIFFISLFLECCVSMVEKLWLKMKMERTKRKRRHGRNPMLSTR